jgi:uncharacterized Zn finger protein
MEYTCTNCGSKKRNTEVIKIEYTKEVVTVLKCMDCGTVLNAEIERPKGMVLKRKRGAGEIRFSENEKRNFSSILLSMQETQINLLASIASEIGVEKEEIERISKKPTTDRKLYEYLIGEDDDSKPPDLDD